MGMYRRDHIVFGWKLKNENYRYYNKIDLYDDKFLPLIEGHRGEKFTLVLIRGEFVFGFNIASEDEWDFQNLNVDILNNCGYVKEKFKELFEIDAPSDPTLFIFSNFS